MKSICIIGYGSLGNQVEKMLLNYKCKKIRFKYFDDFAVSSGKPNSFNFRDYVNYEFKDCLFVIALGYKHLRIKCDITNWMISNNRQLLSFIHPTSFINSSANIEQGVIIYPMCNLDTDVLLKSGVLLNNSVIVSHGTTIGAATYISPGVIISGNVTIGEKCFIGSGTLITNNIRIGNNVVIGIGSCITKDIPDNSIGIGNPFRITDRPLNIT